MRDINNDGRNVREEEESEAVMVDRRGKLISFSLSLWPGPENKTKM